MKGKSTFLVLLLLVSFVPAAQADSTDPVTITVDWGDDHAYIITGQVELSNISVSQMRDGESLDVGIIYDTTGDDLRIELNSTLAYGDEITIFAGEVSRSLTVGLWGQPLEDHEVTLDSQWEMNQQWVNENGTQKYILIFNGQGWQQMVGNTTESWEMGNGSLMIVTSTEEGSLALNLDLDSVWKNETISDGIFNSQIFDARGSGGIQLSTQDEDGQIQIEGTVSDAWINRTMLDGIIDERFRLEANGSMVMNGSDDDGEMSLDGEIAVLLIETWDSNGTRKLDFQQIEATADLMIENNDSAMDITLEVFESLAHWEDGERIDHHEKLVGYGNFGFTGSDENASVQVNGTIIDFHQEQEDGLVIVDDIHIDGLITGDMEGNFGLVRTIEEFDTQPNETGVMYDVAIIHHETWFNLTGITALPNSDLGAGAHHNDSYYYDAVQAHWDNRTIRNIWTQTGPDPSSGDEYPANSPIETPLEAPESEGAIGDAIVGRESGFAPIDARPGDVFRLDGTSGMVMTVTCGELGTNPIDGHIVDTLSWTGVYSMDVNGTAFGSLIIDGPLSGMNVEIQRMFEVPFGEDDQLVNLTEIQGINRILSPSVISAQDNSAPVIVSISLAEGVITGEGGSPGHLEVVVSDVDYNVESVSVDLTEIGGVVLQLNDRGLDGDMVIGDDVWTAQISVPGIEVGSLNITATATDAFAATAEATEAITVLNQPPRLTAFAMVPTIINRGESLIVNAEVIDGHGVSSVEIDMRDYGGDLQALNRVGDIWTGQVVIPDGMSPGERLLKVRMVDELESAIIVTRTITSGQHHIESELDEDIVVTVLNTPPQIDVGELRVIERGDENIEYTLSVIVTDHDGLNFVRVRLGILAPPGQSNTWFTMTPGDNSTWSYTFTINKAIAYGTHEVLVKAKDSYGEISPEASVPIQITEKKQTITEGGPSNDLVAYTAIAGLGILLILGAVFYVKRGDSEGGGFGGFGDA